MIRRGNLEDFDILFKWINDEDVVIFSRYGKGMDLEQFSEWFEDRIDSLFIIEEDLVPLGQICYELSEDGEAVINYCVDKEERGKGYGKALVRYLIEFIKYNNDNINKISGYVHLNNVKSIKIFEDLGFNKECNENYLKFYIDIH